MGETSLVAVHAGVRVAEGLGEGVGVELVGVGLAVGRVVVRPLIEEVVGADAISMLAARELNTSMVARAPTATNANNGQVGRPAPFFFPGR